MDKATTKPRERTRLPLQTRTIVLTEAGYRCAVPTCRGILALDMHHIWEVKAGGGDEPANLIALCPTCHALYHRGTISEEAIYVYKSILVALTHAFDTDTIDKLIFLSGFKKDALIVSGDGLIIFSRLISAGLASAKMKANNNYVIVTYAVNITDRGRQLLDAWMHGNRVAMQRALSPGSGPPE